MRRLALLLLLLPAVALAYTYDVDPASVEFIESNGYVIPSVGEGVYPSEAGLPALPEIPLHIFVPGGGRAVDVEIIGMETREIPGAWVVLPMAEPRPVSQPAEYFAEPDPAIYESAAAYPAQIMRSLGGGNLAGYGIAEVAFSPFIYEPATGSLTLITQIEFEITTEPLDYATVTPDRVTPSVAANYMNRVTSLVINPDEVYNPSVVVEPSYRPTENGPDFGSTAEWVIIVPEAMMSAAEPLRDWKLRKGLTTAIVTTEHIYANYSGRDNAEKIRNFIIDANSNWSSQWFILAGDTNVLPDRRGYVNISGTSEDDRQIPTDLYFADLDGTWNTDGDGYWGESGDIPDMYSDVYVTRLPARSADSLSTMVSKVLTYETNVPDGFVEKALFLGAYLDSSTPGGSCKDVVVPYLPGNYNLTKLYEKFGNINKTLVVAQINAGNCAVVNHCAHSNYGLIGTGPDNMYVNDVNALTNGAEAGWFYSIGCMCGGFDRPVSFAEALVANPNGGMFAVIMNSRYGWYSPGFPGGGMSDRLDQQFFDAVFNENKVNLGMAVADMRDEYAGTARGNAYYRWCVYENNVLGPSETPSYDAAVNDLAANHTDTYTGGNVTVTVTSGGGPVNGALVCLFKNDEVHETATTNGSGVASFSDLPVSTDGDIMVTATAQNYRPYEGTMYCPNSEVKVAQFTADQREEGVLLSWTVEDDGELVGLHLVRDQERLTDNLLSGDSRFLDRAPAGDHAYYLEMVTTEGETLTYGPLNIRVEETAAQSLALSDAYPNPSSGLINIQVDLAERTDCELAVYDLSGRRVATVHNGELAAGRHVLSWDGADSPSGVYIAHLRADGEILTRRLALVR